MCVLMIVKVHNNGFGRYEVFEKLKMFIININNYYKNFPSIIIYKY